MYDTFWFVRESTNPVDIQTRDAKHRGNKYVVSNAFYTSPLGGRKFQGRFLGTHERGLRPTFVGASRSEKMIIHFAISADLREKITGRSLLFFVTL